MISIVIYAQSGSCYIIHEVIFSRVGSDHEHTPCSLIIFSLEYRLILLPRPGIK